MRLQDIDPDRFARLDGLLDVLLDTPREERSARARELCEGDEALHRELGDLLAAMEDDDEHPLHGAVDPSLAFEAADDPLEGQHAGPYELVELLGAGGMGTVFRARRADGAYDREVAVKVVRRGTDSLALVDRFHRERDILARLEHPGITRLVDAGLLEDGRPYLAMDLVTGRPLLAAARALSVRDRVELIEQVCRAVSYAHDRLIIHRDIKPSNVMVTEEGEARLLDFGVAKLVDDDGHTKAGDRMLTPRWAAPEQFDGQVDVRTDLYAIGLLLHTLLSGRDCVERDDDGSCSPPSLQAPASERSKIAGDLDAIVMQALRPDPEARYPSVRALGDDLQRYRQGLPVQARPERWYRLRKTIRRNLGALSFAALFVVSLVGYSITITGQSRALAEERDRATAEARRGQLLSGYLSSLLTSDHAQAVDGEEITVAELLTRSEGRLHSPTLEPDIQAELTLITARAHHTIGHWEDALALARRVATDPSLSDSRRAEALDFMARVELASMRPLRARPLALLGLSFAISGGGLFSTAAGHCLDTTASAFAMQYPTRARALYWTSVGIHILIGGPMSPDIASPLASVATLSPTESDFLLSWTLLSLRGRGAMGAEAADTLHKFGRASEDPKRSLALYEDALALERRVYGSHHPHTLNTLNDLALRLEKDDPLRSIDLLAEASRLLAERLPPGHPRLVVAETNLGAVLRDAGRFDEAEAKLSATLALAEEAKSPMIPFAAYHLAMLHLGVENEDAALETFARGLSGCEDAAPRHLEGMVRVWLQHDSSQATLDLLAACFAPDKLAALSATEKTSDSRGM